MQNGRTVKELDVSHAHGIYPKTKFSMAIPEVNEQLDKLCDGNVQCGVLFGMQAHISIEQTAAELCGLGIQVHVIADACTASSQEERILALQRLKQIGCFITTCESILYKLLGDEDHPKANEVKQLLDKPRPPTGLAVLL
ncbi:isochorismatase domain-containing protein 1 [Nilaparvata lugens]|nr:isochorismatase domain-containing protein 1 [Nilaparvata lugens]